MGVVTQSHNHSRIWEWTQTLNQPWLQSVSISQEKKYKIYKQITIKQTFLQKYTFAFIIFYYILFSLYHFTTENHDSF